MIDLNRLGGQRVGVGRHLPVFDDGRPVLDEFKQPATADVVLWVSDCLFEIQQSTETGDTSAVTAAQTAWCFLPVRGGVIPAVDDNGRTVGVPVAEVTSRAWLVHAGQRYELIGDAVLEVDDAGAEDHVFALCRRRV